MAAPSLAGSSPLHTLDPDTQCETCGSGCMTSTGGACCTSWAASLRYTAGARGCFDSAGSSCSLALPAAWACGVQVVVRLVELLAVACLAYCCPAAAVCSVSCEQVLVTFVRPWLVMLPHMCVCMHTLCPSMHLAPVATQTADQTSQG